MASASWFEYSLGPKAHLSSRDTATAWDSHLVLGPGSTLNEVGTGKHCCFDGVANGDHGGEVDLFFR